VCISRTLGAQRQFFVIIKHNPLLYIQRALAGTQEEQNIISPLSALARAESDGCIHLFACSISQTSSERRI
jgi:hypothetical protein